MHSIKTPTFSFRLRSAVLGFTAAGLFYACLPSVSMGVPSRDERVERYEVIDQAEGAKRMAAFRSLRLEGDFCFKFQLKHKPRKDRTVRYNGIMYGSWNERGPVSRFKLFPEEIGKDAPVGNAPIELIVQNGISPKVWIRHQSTAAFSLIEDDALFEPIFEGVLYTPFDLQMPFVFWDNYSYEGPSRVSSRVGQCFLMQPPAGSLAEEFDVSAVRIALDDTYYALLKAEVFGGEGELRSTFEAGVLRKIQGQWIVREVSLQDAQSKDVTDFNVKAASVGLIFDAAVFDPDSNVGAPEISAALFEVL